MGNTQNIQLRELAIDEWVITLIECESEPSELVSHAIDRASAAKALTPPEKKFAPPHTR